MASWLSRQGPPKSHSSTAETGMPATACESVTQVLLLAVCTRLNHVRVGVLCLLMHIKQSQTISVHCTIEQLHNSHHSSCTAAHCYTALTITELYYC